MCSFNSWIAEKINLCNKNSIGLKIWEPEQKDIWGYGIALGKIFKKDVINDKKRDLNIIGLHKH